MLTNTQLDPDRLRDGIRELMATCEETGEPPVAYKLRQVTGIGERELEEIRGYRQLTARERNRLTEPERRRRTELMEAVERLDEYRTWYWLKRGLDNPRLVTFAMFNLRQPSNGGYSDGRGGQSAQRAEVVIETEGVGDGAFD